MKIHWMIYTLLGLVSLDGISTWIALRLVPSVFEMNPIPNALGWPFAIAVKILGSLLFAWLLNISLTGRDKRIKLFARISTGFVMAVYVFVLFSNSMTAISGLE